MAAGMNLRDIFLSAVRQLHLELDPDEEPAESETEDPQTRSLG
jgi:hypothetical protein